MSFIPVDGTKEVICGRHTDTSMSRVSIRNELLEERSGIQFTAVPSKTFVHFLFLEHVIRSCRPIRSRISFLLDHNVALPHTHTHSTKVRPSSSRSNTHTHTRRWHFLRRKRKTTRWATFTFCATDNNILVSIGGESTLVVENELDLAVECVYSVFKCVSQSHERDARRIV